jgi:alpha-tubulin suppressor-like RCC1 family protein
MSSPSAATSQRRVLCGVGSNFNGQLGLGLTLPRKEPFAPVPLGSSAADREVLEQCVDVQCGSQFTAVLDANGQV